MGPEITPQIKNSQIENEKKLSSFGTFLAKQKESLNRAIKHFSIFEKTVFFVLFATMTLSAGALVLRLNDIFVVEVPLRGGSLHEGIIGSPRFINPVIAISDPDRDLTALIYSGLTRILPNGEIVPDLAEEFEISEDGKTYTFFLKNNIYFHDGEPVTTEDIEFTIQKIQDAAIKSPKRANWVGVGIEKINEREIRFHLRQAYAPFIFNTNVGILPKHLWKDASAEEFPFSPFNSDPIGSGPFKVGSVVKNSGGFVKTYNLEPFSSFTLGKPYIDNFSISFYPNEEELLLAFSNGEIKNINSISVEKLKELITEEKNGISSTLPRIFGVFFNQNQASVLLDSSVREALNLSLDKEKVVEEVLSGFGSAVDGPLPPQINKTASASIEKISEEERIQKAREILEKGGWKTNEETGYLEKTVKKGNTTEKTVLAFSVSTANIPELKQTAEILKNTWGKIGAQIDVKIFESGDLNQNVIRPRKCDALLFGEIIGRDMDLYAFWHSSQRNDPGLNIALYANTKADTLLEEARVVSDTDERLKKYDEFSEEIKKDAPAIFLYSPEFIYILPKEVKGVDIRNITVPSERLSQSYLWYINTEKVWKVFAR